LEWGKANFPNNVDYINEITEQMLMEFIKNEEYIQNFQYVNEWIKYVNLFIRINSFKYFILNYVG